MDKSALRSAVIDRLRAAPATAGDVAAATARLLALPEVAAASCVAAYVGTGHELPTVALLDALAGRGVRVLLPCLSDGEMTWRMDEGPARRVSGPHGLVQPDPQCPAATLDQAEVVVVPAVAVTRDGGRLGRGAGHYDRALAALSGVELRVSLVADAAVEDELPTEAHDQAVDVVVTPTGVFWRTGHSALDAGGPEAHN